MNFPQSSSNSREQGHTQNQGVAGVVSKNIESLVRVRRTEEKKKSLQHRIADALTQFSGSMVFVYFHAGWFGVWIALNTGLSGSKPFDPFPFSLLTLVVSLEAIFLSTFVLISQNHASKVADRRADLDLQINLLAEHEITRLLTLMDAVANHLGVDVGEKPKVEELKQDVGAEQVLDEIEWRQKTAEKEPVSDTRSS